MLAALATAMTTALCADQPKHNPERATQPATRREEPRRSRPRMSPPVYAPSETKSESTSKADRSKLDNARRRRIEIMVLINACKIMPEADRAPLKKELLKRIDADFQAMVVDQKERIARAEAELQRLRQELANPKPAVVSEEKEPFYDKLCQCAGVDFEERHDNIIAITDNVMVFILKAITIPNIWTKPTDVEKLRGNIGTALRFSGIQQLKENSESIVTELIKLAKSNESVLRKCTINN